MPAGLPEGDGVWHCRSPFLLLEDGRPLRRPHATHNDIRISGGGQYSHWGSALFFSTSDNSDPRTNGRSYALAFAEVIAGIDHPEAMAPADGPISTLFIVGCLRSGTTLLFDLLKGHPRLAATEGYPEGEDHDGWIKHGGALISSPNAVRDCRSALICCLHQDETDVNPQVIAAMRGHYAQTVLRGDFSKLALNKNPHLSKLRYVLTAAERADIRERTRGLAGRFGYSE